MSPAVLSVLGLLAAIAVSCTSRINAGLIALPLAWGIGLYGGMTADQVAGKFPSSLFVTLAGVTLLFSLAEVNGAVGRVAAAALRLAKGSARLVPLVLFGVAAFLSSVGPGAVAACALVIPMGMAMGLRAGVPAFLMALMMANGANAGNLSAFSSVGVIVNTKMAEAGLGGHATLVWFWNFIAHVIVSAAAYVGLRGFALRGRAEATADDHATMTGGQRFTMAVIAVWIAGVVALNLHLGLSAFAAAAALVLANVADESDAVRRMPWSTLILITGMSVLIGVLEQTGGLALFTKLIAALATPSTVNAVIAFVTGIISSYSSTSGVVLPTFLPMAPALAKEVGGADPLAVALSINVGSSLVDVSPLSTLGALAVAAISDTVEARRLFRNLMIWGFSMSLVGALLCQLFAGPLARW